MDRDRQYNNVSYASGERSFQTTNNNTILSLKTIIDIHIGAERNREIEKERFYRTTFAIFYTFEI